MHKKQLKTGVTLILIAISSLNSLFSQNLEGKISDKDKNPIYGSTVFIKEVNQGLACNENGMFQATLADGIYTVEYRCLGYESFTEKVTVHKDKITHRDITLNEKAIELNEVVVSNKEDPAYEIMRQAIKKAPYYQKVVKEFDADAYIKGNMELTDVSKIIDKLSKDGGVKMSDYKNKLFIQESNNNIKFTAPDKYEQTVNAFSSSIPDNLNPKDVMSIMRGSLYLPYFSGMVSPLNPKAFTYYKFRYEGFTEENKQIINKITIIPKMKDSELMSGYILIADNSWDIRYAELSSNIYGIQQDFGITYNAVAENIYMPTTYNNRAGGGIMGVKGYFNYFASIKYNKIIIDEKLLKEDIKKPKKKKESLEIKREERFKVTTDSLATKRDSLYWAQIRNIPLNNR